MTVRSVSPLGPALLLGALCAGCAPDDGMFEPVRARTMQEAGSVHLSVLSVAPWSEYVSALQPDFGLTADGALAQVAADSRWMMQDATKMAGFGREPVVLGTSDGVNQVFQPPNRERGTRGWPEDYERLGEGSALPERLTPSGDAPATGPDAMLMYTAATALYQEVQLLNRYIESAAIPDGFRPYIVRLQVSLMPSRRHAPYDAYTTISFFIHDENEPADDRDRLAHASPFGNGPKILPLLVTDNLEASVNSRSITEMLSIYFGWLEFPDDSFVEPLYEAILNDTLRNEVYGRDLNSLLTLARLSENTVRIRLGAVQETTANYAMIPRNHNITLLMMVPDEAPPLMEVVSKTALVDTTTGRHLDGSVAGTAPAFLRTLSRDWNLAELPPDTLTRLLELAQRNDHEQFEAVLAEQLPADHQVRVRQRAFWIELVSFMVGSEYSSHLFELPGQEDDLEGSLAVFHGQTVLAEDDERTMRIVLREARVPEFEQMLAVLTLPPPAADDAFDDADEAPTAAIDDAPAPRGILLPAESVEIDSSRREVRLRFPSLSRLKLIDESIDVAPPRLRLRLSWSGQSLEFDVLHRIVDTLDEP